MVLRPVLELGSVQKPCHPMNSIVKDLDYLADNVCCCRLSHFEARSQWESGLAQGSVCIGGSATAIDRGTSV